MYDIDELTFKNKQILVQGLGIECPMKKTLETCLVKDVKRLPLKIRLVLLKEMEEYQLDEIIEHHRQCLKVREQKKQQL